MRSTVGPAPGVPGTGESGERFKSARRVFKILELIGDREGLTAKLLARELGVSLSTCYHLINILIEEGYVEKMPHRKGYRLGPTFSLLHRKSFRNDLSSRVEAVIGELAERSMRHVYLGLLEDGAVTVAQVKSPPKRPPVDLVRAGSGSSHALALGKVLIASTGPEGIREYVENQRLESFTPRTIVQPAQLTAHLFQILDRGFATDVEEFEEDLCCVSAPLRGGDGGIVGAIGVSTSFRCFEKDAPSLVGMVRQAAGEASALLK